MNRHSHDHAHHHHRHPCRRLVVALLQPYDQAREQYETLVLEADSSRFFQMASWQATLELAEINAPHGFMRYYRSDITAAMAGSPSFWKATQYLMGNHTIAEHMFRHELDTLLAQLITLLGGDAPPHLAAASREEPMTRKASR